jgi:DNA-binding MarR family transcriptional regulator
MPAFRTLIRVKQEPQACLSDVADFLGASLPTTSRIVGNLVDRGLLTRQSSSDDRRHVSLSITPQGRAMLEQGWSATETKMAEEIAGLSSAQRDTVLQSMLILKGIFGSAGLPKRPMGRASEKQGKSPARSPARPAVKKRRATVAVPA